MAFVALVHGACEAGASQQAERHFQAAVESGLIPTVNLYTPLVRRFAQDGNMAKAEAWFQKILQAGLKPGIFPYTSLVSGFLRQGDLKKAEDWLQKSRQAGLRSDSVMYSALIDGYCKEGSDEGLRRAQELLEVMGRPKHRLVTKLLRRHAERRRFAYDPSSVVCLQEGLKLLTAVASEGLPELRALGRSGSLAVPAVLAALHGLSGKKGGKLGGNCLNGLKLVAAEDIDVQKGRIYWSSKDHFAWPLQLRSPHLEVWLFVTEDCHTAGLLLLRQAQARPVYTSSTGLHPNVAWAMVTAAAIQRRTPHTATFGLRESAVV
eukprot:g19470.t1